MPLGLLDQGQALGAFNTTQDAAIARDVTTLLGGQADSPALAHAAHTMLPELINTHADNASLFTAQWYDGLDPGSSYRAKPLYEIPDEQITKSIDWGLYAPGEQPPIERLTSTSQRLARQASRQTVVRNADKEGVRWARMAQPTACAFCRLLAARGSGDPDHKWLYHSEHSAEFRSDGEKYHDHCDCVPVAVRGKAVWVPPEYATDWDQQYASASKKVKGSKDRFKRILTQIREDYGDRPPEEAAPEVKPPAAPEVKPPILTSVPTAPDHLAKRAAQTAAQDVAAKAAKDELLKELDAAKDWRETQKLARKILPNTDVNFGGVKGGLTPETGRVPDVEVTRDVVKAVDDVMTAFPQVALEALRFRDLANTTYAETTNWPKLRLRAITMNRHFTDLPGMLINSWNNTLRTGFHHPGTDAPAYNVIVHEMGHVMAAMGEDNGVTITEDMLMAALSDYFIATRGRGAMINDFRKWVLDGLSGYSKKNPNAATDIDLDVGEALAEAFADSFVNAADAQEVSKVISKVLTDALVGQSYWEARSEPIPA